MYPGIGGGGGLSQVDAVVVKGRSGEQKGHWALVSGTSVAPSRHALPMLSLYTVI